MVTIGQKWSLIFLILFPLFLYSCASRQSQPDKERELSYISEQEEIKFGNYVDAVVAHHYPTYKDETLTRKVAHIGNQVVSVSDRPDLTFTFKILNTSEVNAFAGPGGFVYVTIGLQRAENAFSVKAGGHCSSGSGSSSYRSNGGRYNWRF
jgi:predicted Zn-dependent protease